MIDAKSIEAMAEDFPLGQTAAYTFTSITGATTLFGLLWYPGLRVTDAVLAGVGTGLWAAIVFPIVMYSSVRLANRVVLGGGDPA